MAEITGIPVADLSTIGDVAVPGRIGVESIRNHLPSPETIVAFH
jgi:hypothetical protein